MAAMTSKTAMTLDVQALRGDFPILSRMVNGKPLVYLDNAATTQKPRSVIQSLVDYYENYNANVHRGVHTLSMEATDMTEAARKKVADFINAEEPETVIWTRNATEGLNIVAHSWCRGHIEPGDEIVTTPMEHHSNLVPWQEIAAERGAILRFIPLSENGTLDLSDVDAIITERTKLLAFTHASNSLGSINPAKLLTEKAHAVGATVLVDGAQSVPHMPVDVQDIGCDFLAFSGHKMMGPTGIGALYGRRELLEEMEPFLTGGEMVLQVTYEKASWADLPWKFEAGTPNIADSIGLGAAVDYLTALGMENVREHEKQITSYALERFKEIEEVDVFGPHDPELRGGVVSFHNEDVHPHDLGTFLDQQGIAVRTGHHCTMPLMGKLGVPATARASFYVYNTEQEVDALVDGVKGACDTLAMDSPSIDELYHDAILDHRRNPRNQAVLDNPHASARAVNPFCGDEVNLQLVFSDGRVSGVGVQAVGCSINQSSASMLSEAVVGKTVEEILHLATTFEGIMEGQSPSPRDAADMYDLPTLSAVREYPVRIKCALLSWTALEDALGGCATD